MRAVSPLPPCVESSKEESAELFLQQTGCPACEIHACISDFTEKLFRNPRWLEMEASSIVSGLAGFFSGRTGPCPSNSVIIKIDGEPAAGTAVSLDGVFTAVTDQDGTAVFPCAGHGTHYLLIDIPGLGPGGCLPFEISPGDTGLTEFDLP